MSIRNVATRCNKTIVLWMVIVLIVLLCACTILLKRQETTKTEDGELFSAQNIDMISKNWRLLIEEELFWEIKNDSSSDKSNGHFLQMRSAFLSQEQSLYHPLYFEVYENVSSDKVDWNIRYAPTSKQFIAEHPLLKHEITLRINSPQLKATFTVYAEDEEACYERLIKEWQHILNIVSAK